MTTTRGFGHLYLATLAHVTLSTILLVLLVMMLLLTPETWSGQLKINHRKGKMTGLEFLADFAVLALRLVRKFPVCIITPMSRFKFQISNFTVRPSIFKGKVSD